jgi:hypothetical protein
MELTEHVRFIRLKLDVIFYRIHFDPNLVCDLAVLRRLRQRMLEEFHRRLISLLRQGYVTE